MSLICILGYELAYLTMHNCFEVVLIIAIMTRFLTIFSNILVNFFSKGPLSAYNDITYIKFNKKMFCSYKVSYRCSSNLLVQQCFKKT